MLLRATRNEEAEVEARALQRLKDRFGDVDTSTLAEWVWDRHRDGVRYVEALSAIAAEVENQGEHIFHNLLDVAKKPKHIRDAEMDIFAWVKPRLEQASNTIRGHRGDPRVKEEVTRAFFAELENYLHRVWPRHRATTRGAIFSAFRDEGGRLSFNVAELVRVLDMEDPLSATADTAGAHR